MSGFYLAGPDGVVAVAPMARSGDTLSFVGNQDTVDYNDFMVKPGHEAALYHALLLSMDEQRCNTLRLASLRQTSPTLEHLPELARERGFSVEVQEEDVASGIALPDSWDDYLGVLSKKDRHELRRKIRRLETLPDMKWYCLQEPDQVADRLGKFIELMRLSRPDKDEWMTPGREQFLPPDVPADGAGRNAAIVLHGVGWRYGGHQPLLRLRLFAACCTTAATIRNTVTTALGCCWTHFASRMPLSRTWTTLTSCGATSLTKRILGGSSTHCIRWS